MATPRKKEKKKKHKGIPDLRVHRSQRFEVKPDTPLPRALNVIFVKLGLITAAALRAVKPLLRHLTRCIANEARIVIQSVQRDSVYLDVYVPWNTMGSRLSGML